MKTGGQDSPLPFGLLIPWACLSGSPILSNSLAKAVLLPYRKAFPLQKISSRAGVESWNPEHQLFRVGELVPKTVSTKDAALYQDTVGVHAVDPSQAD